MVEVELEEIPLKFLPLNSNEVDVRILKRDPREHIEMCNYPANIRDEVRRAYLKAKPYQIRLSNYPFSREKHPRHFQASWFAQFSSWLEYSPTKDVAYYLPCYLFTIERSRCLGCDDFTFIGFRNWKKVNNGKNCTFLNHVGEDPCSPLNNAVK